MRDTRLNLNNQKFEQALTDVLNLSGFTEFNGTLRLNDGNQQTGYVMTSDSTGGTSWQSPQVTTGDINYVSGVTDQNTTDINYISGVTSGNTTDIATNAANITFISGVTVTGASAPDTSVQFNNNGAFSGSSCFTWDNTINQLDIGGDLAISGTSFLRAGGNTISSIELGQNANSETFTYGIALGFSSCLAGNDNIAIGCNAQASGTSTIAIGDGAISQDLTSIAIGQLTVVDGNRSIAIGRLSCTSGNYATAIGQCSYAFSQSNAIGSGSFSCGGFAGGGGARDYDGAAIGKNAKVYGRFGIAIGSVATVSGSSAIGIGYKVSASTGNAIAIGCEADAVNINTIAIGSGAYVDGNAGIAIGINTDAGGSFSTAVGDGSQAIGGNAIAIGRSSYSNNSNTIAIGCNSDATGLTSTAIGNISKAFGDSAIAIGCCSGAYCIGSVAIGRGSKSESPNGISIGRNAGSNFGSYEVTIGVNSCVSGFTSGLPQNNVVIGRNACAIGRGQISIGHCAGSVLTPNGETNQRYNNAISIGCNANRNVNQGQIGANTIAIGNNATTPTACSIAIGIGAYAYALDNITIGKYACSVAATDSINIGGDSLFCSSNCSFALGHRITMTGASNSIGIGRWLCVDGSNQILMGGGVNNTTCLTNGCGASVGFGWGVTSPSIRFTQDGNSYLDGASQQLAIGHTGATAKLDICTTTACDGFRLRDGNETNNWVLTSDASGYGTWKSVGAIGGSGITGSTNGLTDNGSDVCLGGTLTQTTNFDGGGSYGFGMCCLTSFCIGNCVANEEVGVFDVFAQDEIILNSVDLTGSVPYRGELQLESSLSCCSFVGTRSGTTNLVRLLFNPVDGGMVATDDVGLKGIDYAACYHSNYTNRTLVDKEYVDTVASGLDAKDAVSLATTTSDGDIDISGGTFSSGNTIDGVVVMDGWRVLIKNQTDAVENGVYDYSASASGFTRSTDFDGTPSGEVSNGAFMTVVTGDTLANSQWILTTPDPITIDTTELTFSVLSQQQGITGGDGIDVSTVGANEEISIDLASNSGLQFNSGQLEIDYVTKTSNKVNQSSHGFVVGDVVSWSGGTYIKSLADGTQDSEIFGLVTEVTDANNFTVTLQGFVDTLSGLVANTTYFVSDTTAGQLTATEPTTDGHISKPILTTTSSTAGLVLPYRGNFISTGDTSINQAANGLSVDGTAIKMGGSLCENTTITLGSYSLNYTAPLNYTTDVSGSFGTYSFTDVNYVTGITSGLQADIDFISGETNTPAGSDTQVQYNSGGTFGASSCFTFNDTTNQLNIGGDIAISGTSFLRAGSDATSIELGSGALTSELTGIAIGENACTTTQFSIAIGSLACATGNNRAVALGRAAIAGGDCGLALGDTSSALSEKGIAVGRAACTIGLSSLSLGDAAITEGISQISIGSNAGSTSGNGAANCAISIGHNANQGTLDIGGYAIAIGVFSESSGLDSIAIGNSATANQTSVASFSALEVITITGRCLAEIVSLVSGM